MSEAPVDDVAQKPTLNGDASTHNVENLADAFSSESDSKSGDASVTAAHVETTPHVETTLHVETTENQD